MWFCVQDQASTGINTYCRTPAVHDALPMSDEQPGRVAAGPERGTQRVIGCLHTRFHAHRVVDRITQRVVEFHEVVDDPGPARSEEHTSELQSLMRISYAVFCLKKKNNKTYNITRLHIYKNTQ